MYAIRSYYAGRELHLAGGAGDGDAAALQGFAQGIQHPALELGQLVEEQDAVVGQGDLARITSYNVCYTKLLRFWDAHQLVADIFTLQASFWAFFWVLFFAAATYANAGWMRSIVCTHMCPYARFQSAMFDQDTYTVSYDAARGEPRGARTRKQDPKALGLGDCIDCSLCVQVCPADIDIRNGLQYECINCGACVDACDQTMERMGYAPGLISYTSEQRLAGGQTRLLRAKLLGYGLVLLIMLGVLIYNLLAVMP